MEFCDPLWRLKTPRCECCSAQGALCFATCTNCGHVVLVCDEVGTVFPNPKNLTEAVYGADDYLMCPSCNKILVANFRNSTTDEIRVFGFTAEDYE